MRGDEVTDRVAAELVLRGDGELPGDGGLGDDGERLHCGDVRPLDERRCRLARLQVDGREWLHQRRERLHRRADDDLLAVRDAGFDPAGAVRVAPTVGPDLVVRLRSAKVGERKAVADLHTLDRLNAHERKRETGVEPVLLRRVRAEARRDALRAHLDGAADRVALGARGIDVRAQALLVDDRSRHADTDRRKKRLRDGAGGDVHGRVPGRGPLERVADVVVAVLEHAREIGVPRPRERHGLCPLAARLAVRWPRRHPPGPVLVVDVPDDERERRAECAPLAQAREHLDAVRLDLLARRAAVALLPPPQVGVNRVAVQHEPGGEAADDGDECGAVRLAGGSKAERQAAKPRGVSAPLQCAAVAVALQILASGFAAGAVYGLVAVGHSLVFRLTGVVHFAFGELIALGVFVTLLIAAGSGPVSQTSVGGARFLLALAIGLLITAGASAGAYFLAIEPYRARGSVIGWVGASLAVAFAVRTLLVVFFDRPAYVFPDPLPFRRIADGGFWHVGGATIQVRTIFVAAVALALAAVGGALLQRTRFGRALEAIAQDFDAAVLVGLPVARLVGLAFALAGVWAGLAAVLAAPSAAFDVDAAARYGLYGLLAAAVVWFDPTRALFAGIALGLVQATVTSAHLGGFELGPAYRDVVPLALGLLLFAWRGRTMTEDVE